MNNITKINVLIISLSFFFICHINTAIAQTDNYAKNSKISDDEQKRFEEELKTNKDSAEVYWKHAKIMGEFTFNAYKNAWKFYEKAISIDSSKPVYFIDYGNYLTNKLQAYDYANKLYKRAVKLFPDNTELNNGLININKEIEKKEAEKKFSDVGKAKLNEIKKATDYKSVTDFDALSKQTKNKKSEYYYPVLLEKFLSDKDLDEQQTYMLLIGYTQQDAYKPYNQDANKIFDLNENGNFDEAIIKANELLIKNPVSVAVYKELIYAYRKKGNAEKATIFEKRLHKILNAMLYTGNGTCDKPYVVLTIIDEYTLLSYLNFQKTGSVSTVNCAGQMADSIEVTNISTKEKSELNFNISLIFKSAMK